MTDHTDWVPCSPEWLRSMPEGSCATQPRRYEDDMHSHLHPNYDKIMAEINKVNDLLAVFVHAVADRNGITRDELRNVLHEADDTDFAAIENACLKTGTITRSKLDGHVRYRTIKPPRYCKQWDTDDSGTDDTGVITMEVQCGLPATGTVEGTPTCARHMAAIEKATP